MAPTRGPMSRHPCTRDLVARDDLALIATNYEKRTSQSMLRVINQALRLMSIPGMKGRAEALLKDKSLRPISVRVRLLAALQHLITQRVTE